MKKNTIFDFFDGLCSKISCCLLSKKTVSESDLLLSEERSTIDLIGSVMTFFWRQSLALPLVMGVIMMTGYTVNAQNITGRAPVLAPKGGFAVDGNAFVRFTGDNPDWGDFLFENQSAPITANPGGIFVPVPPPYDYRDGILPKEFYVYPGFTTFFRDNITNEDPTIFTGSNKINDNPTTYEWGVGSSPDKNEIQNAIAHFSYADGTLQYGKDGDLWMIFAADRQVTNGSSYIDFEILQAPLTKHPLGTDSKGFPYGNFSSEGPDNGRTIGDILVTIEFTQGGGSANVVVRKWNGTSYGIFTPLEGTIFGTNNTAVTPVPYPIYNQDPVTSGPNAGMWEYAPNQWAEGAANLTELFGIGNDPCFVISTLFVRTRTSGSSGQSELKDFPGEPLQLNLCTDKTPPALTCPADISFDCKQGDSGTATATDNCDPNPKVEYTDSGSLDTCGLGVITRTWKATDECGNISSCVQTITVKDDVKPVITCPANATFDCTQGDSGIATATDNCDESPDISYSDAGTLDACGLGVITRTWKATDCAGNFSTCVQTITVKDDVKPVITCPADATFDCEAGNSGVATATDNCDANPVVTFSDSGTLGNCGSGIITRTWKATDCAGNFSTCVQKLTIKDDTKPVITCPRDISFDCTQGDSGTATATDNCDPNPKVEFTDAGTLDACGLGVITRTWKATDACGNFSTCVQKITVKDDTKPVITCPADISFDCKAGDSGEAMATDNCTEKPAISYSDEGTLDACGLGIITRTWKATDCAGNFSTCVQKITVKDDTAPIITCPADVSYECDAVGGFGEATATDNCDANPKVTYTDVKTNDCGDTYHIDRTWKATDCAGNTSTCVQKIKVVDTTKPTLVCKADKTIECNAEVIFDEPTATDNCDANPIIEIVSTSPDGLTRTWKATDACGNDSATCSQTITVKSCPKALCTYTQGYYGNPGGMSCAPDDGVFSDKYTTEALIAKALAYYGGTMTVGLPGNSVLLSNNSTDIAAIIDVLPGGGSSYVLLAGDPHISALTGIYSSYLSKNGRLNNTLLAQTITLGLNIGINSALGDFVLQGGVLVTADPEGGCGSDIPKERTCNYDQYGNLINVTNDYHYNSIDASVVTALNGNPTVQGLFELANKALGGVNTGVSLSAIASVVDKINNAFDGCTIFMGYDVPQCDKTSLAGTSSTDSKMEPVGFDAYPVPFKDVLTIKYNFDYVSDVKIEVFNSTGKSVLSKADTNSYLNKEVALNLKMNRGQEQVYVVKVTTNRGSSVKKVMSSK